MPQFPDKPPIINCHTHIFTGDHVPPYLAKTFLPWPVYFLLPLRPVVSAFRFWFYKVVPRLKSPSYRKKREAIYKVRMVIQRTGVIRVAVFLIGVFLTISTFFILVDWLSRVQDPGEDVSELLAKIRAWMTRLYIPEPPQSPYGRIAIVLALIIFFKAGRNVIWFLLKRIFAFLGALPGPKSKALAKRYLSIGRFAFHYTQSGTWEQLQAQYPAGTGFVVLPMDMEYMEGGALKKGKEYFHQMEELRKLKEKESEKNLLYPFVFVEPRRIADEMKSVGDREKPLIGKQQLKWSAANRIVQLGDCFIRDYIETYGFTGFKIYPALGYYPFDEELLPLWKYAADNGIPILTHCIRGNIYYRGAKKKAWDKHPVFVQSDGKGNYDDKLALMEIKNSEFINNFTHPMNYLCLLDEEKLRIVVMDAKNQNIRELFGYTDKETPLRYNLQHLKLCFGHFGGDDEWDRFMELDRDLYARQLVKHPHRGIKFFLGNEGNVESKGKQEQIWRSVDWYSIVCSIMLQYDNVYSDLSYILYNDGIHPLLKQTLMNPRLRERTLFGTDFFVVRNHKSEKGLLASIIDSLSEQDFDQIARINPREFLNNRIHGAVRI